MALVVGSNSWVSRAEADAYLEYRVDASAWDTLDDVPASFGAASKDSYLVTAFYWLYNNVEFEVPLETSDPNVKNAQIEAALFLMKYQGDYEKREALISSGVTSFERSKWKEDLGAVSLPDRIKGMLVSYNNANAVVQLYPEDYDDERT